MTPERPDIWFTTDRNGRKVAYRWNWGAGRAVRMSLADAELWAATDAANVVDGHPLKG